VDVFFETRCTVKCVYIHIEINRKSSLLCVSVSRNFVNARLNIIQ